MKNTKILMTLMGMEIGGAETHVLELCKALVKRGMKVYVASNGGIYEPELEACGIIHYKVPLHNKRLDNIVNAYFALKKIIISNDIRLVHAHARIPGFLCGLLQKKLRFRFVTTAHWVFTTEFPYNILSDWGEKSLAVSDDIRRYLMDNYNVPDKNIYITVNGIDTEKFSPEVDCAPIKKTFALQNGEIRIVALNRMDTDRSLAAHLLIKAAPALIKEYPRIKICLVGDGDDYQAVRREADAMNASLSARIILLAGGTTEVNQWMAAADIFVGASRAVLEAMSACRPVVASGNEGYLGLLTPGNLATAIETNFCYRGCGDATAEKLTADLLTLLKMPEEERKKAGQSGRAVVQERYSISRMAEDAMTMYKAVIDSPYPSVTPARRLSRRRTGVVISGYYGYNNNGDDMLLRSIIDNLHGYRRDLSITVLSMRPKETRAQYGVNAVYRFNFLAVFLRLMCSKMLITGGGTLMQDETSTQSLIYYSWVINTAWMFKLKNMLYANGIGPVTKPGNVRRVQKTLNRVDLITLRENESLEVLKSIDVTKPETHVTADAVFALPPADENNAREFLKGIGITGPFFCIAVRTWMNNPASLEKHVATFADHLTGAYGYQALFIPMQPVCDEEISRRVISLMKNPGILMPAEEAGSGWHNVRGAITCAELVLAMRLHALIYAMEKGVPVIGLEYNTKIRKFMDSIGQKWYMPVEETDSNTLIDYADSILKDRNAISESIKTAGQKEREKALMNAKLCMELLGESRR